MTKIREFTYETWTKMSQDADSVMNLVNSGPFIVKSYLSPDQIMTVRDYCSQFALNLEPSWHPLLDDCPDYHRIHDNYAKAHVRSVQHGYYFHTWNQTFWNFFAIEPIREVFLLKAKLSGLDSESFLLNTALEGPVARLVVHQYPRGGGGQEEHVDPISNFARIQTIIQASSPGTDYQVGGLYYRDSDGNKINIDEATSMGDLIIMSPGVRHGVSRIDPEDGVNWQSTSGRWIVLPIILHSDHFADSVERPSRVN